MVRVLIVMMSLFLLPVTVDGAYRQFAESDDIEREWAIKPRAKLPQESWSLEERRRATEQENIYNAKKRMAVELKKARMEKASIEKARQQEELVQQEIGQRQELVQKEVDQREATRIAAHKLVRGEYDKSLDLNEESAPVSSATRHQAVAPSKTIKEKLVTMQETIANAWRNFRFRP